mgnify:CR=1 FL=1
MKRIEDVYSNSLSGFGLGGNYKFWLLLPCLLVTMLAQAPAVYAHAETITVVQQNNATVRGSVKDATGESLIGVSVTVKGKEGVGTITDVMELFHCL